MLNSVIYDRGSVYVKFNDYNEPLILSNVPHYVMKEDKENAKFPAPFSQYGTYEDFSFKRRVSLTDINQTFNFMLQKHSEPRLEDNKWGKVYYLDIETGIGDTFPVPELAEQPITTVSLTSSTLHTVVITYHDHNFERSKQMYLEVAERVMADKPKLKRLYESDKTPPYQIIRVKDERALLMTLLRFIRTKCDYLCGWNMIGFDWPYIYNRCFNQGVNWTDCCLMGLSENASVTDKNDNRHTYKQPFGCQILDTMMLVESVDQSLGAKESLSLEYISNRCFNVGKLKYNCTLKDLYWFDHDQYCAYNGIDTFLTAAIDIHLNLLALLKEYARIGTIPVVKCQSMIALTNALFNKHFNKDGIVIGEWPVKKQSAPFTGGYVRAPRKGKHTWVTCNDFAALYPSSIRTCNLSPESMVEYHLDENEDAEKLEMYRKDPNFFVSVNNNVYKNDRDYAFKQIQTYLTSERNPRKYAGKEINALVSPICEEVNEENINKLRSLSDLSKYWLKECTGLTIDDVYNTCTTGSEYAVKALLNQIIDTVDLLDIQQLAFKKYSNSLYGGVSNAASDYFNLACAEDVTGEGRNATHTMEKCSAFLWNSYIFTPECQAKLQEKGLTLNKSYYLKSLQRQLDDGTYYDYVDRSGEHHKFFDNVIYGDTDSLYISYEDVLTWFDETRDADFDTRYEYMLKFVDITNEYYGMMLLNYYKGRNCRSPEIQNFEIETIAKSALHFMKKQYIQKLIWKDGKDLRHHPKLKKIGLEIVKGSTSAYARTLLTNTLENMLDEDDFDWRAYLESHRDEFNNQPLGNIAGNFKLNPTLYKKYLAWDMMSSEYIPQKGCPFQYKAAAAFNNIIIANRMTDVYQEIKDGKLHVMNAKNDLEWIGFPDEDPIGDVKMVADKDAWWNKTIFDVIDRLAAKLDGRFDEEERIKEERRIAREAKKLMKEAGIEPEKPKKTRKKKETKEPEMVQHPLFELEEAS